MAAHEGGGDGARRPPVPPPRPTLSLPPRSVVGSSFFSAAATESSPGPLTLAPSLFPDAPSPAFQGSFTQLLVGAMGSPAAAAAAAPPSPFAVPHGLSPAALVGGSPGLFSPTGNFEMSHQQALAQVTAQAVHSPYSMINQSDYSLPFSSTTTSVLASHHVNPSAKVTSLQEIPTLPSHKGNSNIESTEVSHGFQTSALTVDKPADDGYNWRKYGQKAVKGGEYPRSYYKCTHSSCPVKKKVERSSDGQITQIIYRGQHNHQRPPKRRSKDGGGLLNEADVSPEKEDASTRSEQGSQDHSGKFEASNDGGPSASKRGGGGEQLSGSSDSDDQGEEEVKVEGGDTGDENANKRHVPAPAQRIIVQTTSEVDLLDDGYRWRKYGQKIVKGNPHPRSYYKCTYQGCDVKKHIERSSQDPKAVITTYEGKHSHDVPAARNSSHSAANANLSSSRNLPHRGQQSSQRDGLRNATSASSLQLKEESG
ncbi:hypothetical protein E2562_034351 [Oryza meyeriana var. granulata]|uniref:WRKY domain-containing protein n=1 Tax=Oryza meyeriana var. granulata TaxID=110450 RepID=A0A6G1ECI3_9ORYZ|nr:hypothetical protein E2562_034351 [Oryza meyeriana var. granulata]